MELRIDGPAVCLYGDWTIRGFKAGIIDSLLSVSGSRGPSERGPVTIDCRDISAIDDTGLQLLYVWTQCARLRGSELFLTNLPDSACHPFHQAVSRCESFSRPFETMQPMSGPEAVHTGGMQ